MKRLGCGLLATLAGCSGGSLGNQDLALAPDLAPACAAASWVEDVSACKPMATDYQPRRNRSRDDAWAPCVSDDGAYHPVDPSRLDGLALTEPVDEIGRQLWSGRAPLPADFVAARAIYERPDGLVRFMPGREDLHYPPAPGGRDCKELGISTKNPSRCVGTTKLVPLLHDAFTRGVAGERPLLQSARIQAVLLWYLYVKVLWDAAAAGAFAFYADDAWAEYGGGRGLDDPAALGRFVRAAGVATHGRVWDGLLAVRCWRSIDNEAGAAKSDELGKRAREQLDRALLRGLALVLRQRLGDLECARVSEEKEAHLAFARLFGELLDRAARAADPDKAARLATALAAEPPGAAELSSARAAIDGLFACP